MPDRATFDHYEVLRRDDGALWELGRGAMGTTYKAFDTNLRCFVALKVINPAYLQSDIARQRFIREARLAAQLRHNNVASVFHLGTEGDTWFYAMEFIDGETVESLIKRTGPLDPLLALRIAAQVARALNAAARLHLVHRDIKPANLMLVNQDDELLVKVIDFGLAKSCRAGDAEESAAISMGGFVGTPHFASPEQLEEKDLDVRSDIYSLGATLWYMLSGRAPFGGTVAQVMSQHLQRPVPLEEFPTWPPPLAALLRHMLAKNPADRPQTPAALRTEIEQVIETLRAQGEQEFPTVIAPPSSRPTPFQVGTLVAGRYQIVADLGETNAGRVLRADRGDVETRLIVLRDDLGSEAFTQIEREVEKLVRFSHPNLVGVLGLETDAGATFLVLEWTHGFSLTDLLRTRRELPLSEVLPLLEQLAAGVDHAIASNCRRLDLALHQVALHFPTVLDEADRNVLLETPVPHWPEFLVKIQPLAMARDLATSATWAGGQTLVEDIAPAAQPAGDGLAARYVTALAAIVYELLGGTLSPLVAAASHGPRVARYVPLATLTEAGNEVLRRALHSAAAFGSAAAFCAALRAPEAAAPLSAGASSRAASHPVAPAMTAAAATTASGHPPVLVPPPVPAAGVERRRRLAPVMMIAVPLLLAVAAAGAWFALGKWRSRFSPGPPPQQSRVMDNGGETPSLASPAPTAVPTLAATPAPPPPPDRGARLRELLARAEADEANGDWPHCLETYQRIQEEFPESDTGRVRLEMVLSNLLASGELMRRVQFEAVRGLLEKAAGDGSVAAMMLLGAHLRGIDPGAAFVWYRTASERGYAPAFTQVGLMYSNGTGVERDLAEAVVWFEQASERGDHAGTTCLAECYLGGKGVPKDEAKAVSLLTNAVAAGNVRAMNLLGTCYHRGVGTEKNFAEAHRLFQQAQENGYADALGNLGVLYMNGEGVERDPRKAVELFQQGANRGSVFCMFQLARCLEGGFGVPQNKLSAGTWFRRAAEAGHPRAIEWCRRNGIPIAPR